jgi:hypothetical protein
MAIEAMKQEQLETRQLQAAALQESFEALQQSQVHTTLCMCT